MTLIERWHLDLPLEHTLSYVFIGLHRLSYVFIGFHRFLSLGAAGGKRSVRQRPSRRSTMAQWLSRPRAR
eukprot:16447041-Heterocapsa_arctica.AAC.1